MIEYIIIYIEGDRVVDLERGIVEGTGGAGGGEASICALYMLL